MIAQDFHGDGTVTEEHLRTFVEDLETLYPYCEDVAPDEDPGSHLRFRLPLSDAFSFVLAKDIDIYSYPRTPRFTRHIVGFEKVDQDMDPTRPVKVQTTYQVGVSTIKGLDCEPEYGGQFVVNYLYEDATNIEGWSRHPLHADSFYFDPKIQIPVWHSMDLSDEERLRLELKLVQAVEFDRLAEAVRLAGVEAVPSDLARFNQFHGLLAVLGPRLKVV